QAVAGRAPPVAQRPPGTDEPGGTPARPTPRGHAVGPRTVRPPARPAGHHRHVAGEGPVGLELRRVPAVGPLLRRQLVTVAGPQHPGPHGPCRAVERGRVLKLVAGGALALLLVACGSQP